VAELTGKSTVQRGGWRPAKGCNRRLLIQDLACLFTKAHIGLGGNDGKLLAMILRPSKKTGGGESWRRRPDFCRRTRSSTFLPEVGRIAFRGRCSTVSCGWERWRSIVQNYIEQRGVDLAARRRLARPETVDI